MNVKIADFGFATDRDLTCLSAQCGSPAYMAPEIILGKKYDGRKADIFALGVTLFGLVCGLAPFNYAMKDDPFYNLLTSNDEALLDNYWRVVGGTYLSADFKHLIRQMLSPNPE